MECSNQKYLLIQSSSLSKGDPGDDGTDGTSSTVYIGYADDAVGSNFSLTPSGSLTFLSFLVAAVGLTPVVGDFTGGWFEYIGDDGTNGYVRPHPCYA